MKISAQTFFLEEKFSSIASYKDLLEKEIIPAKTILLKEGSIAKKIFFIKKGSIRIWFNNAGNDVTLQFFFEKDAVCSFESFTQNTPSTLYIETIKETTVYSITKENFNIIMASSKIAAQELQQFTFKRMLWYQRLFLSRIKDKPQKRYENLLQEHPEIVDRVPLAYIASYLGITPISLSRIRKRTQLKKHTL